MISNNLLQASLLAKLKGETSITSLLGSSSDIKESQWQGDEFEYPAVRIDLESQTPDIDSEPCDWATLLFTVQCFSIDKSSQEADKIAGAVNSFLHKKTYSDTQDSQSFTLLRIKSVGLLSARRTSAEVWQADATFEVKVYAQ